jgi:hypothetical protein
MPKEKMWVEYPDGTHLSKSRTAEGGFKGLARGDDSRDLDTHADLFPIEEDEDADYDVAPQSSNDPDTDLMKLVLAVTLLASLGLGALGMKAYEKAKPHVVKWLDEDAPSAIKTAWRKIAGARPIGAVPASSNESSDEPAVTMTSTEWLEGLRTAVMTRAVSDELWKRLASADIEDDEDGSVHELQAGMASLTPEQVTDGIRLMLEANPSWLDEVSGAALIAVFAGAQAVGSEAARVSVGTGTKAASTTISDS